MLKTKLKFRVNVKDQIHNLPKKYQIKCIAASKFHTKQPESISLKENKNK